MKEEEMTVEAVIVRYEPSSVKYHKQTTSTQMCVFRGRTRREKGFLTEM